jgi:hypothetical protein
MPAKAEDGKLVSSGPVISSYLKGLLGKAK